MISVMLVDDDVIVRYGLKMRIALERDLRVIGEARDGREALELLTALNPDVVVMDFEMPQMNGITAARQIRETSPRTGIVMLSLYNDETTRTCSKNAGVDMFIAKGENENELLNAIRATAAIYRGEQGEQK